MDSSVSNTRIEATVSWCVFCASRAVWTWRRDLLRTYDDQRWILSVLLRPRKQTQEFRVAPYQLISTEDIPHPSIWRKSVIKYYNLASYKSNSGTPHRHTRNRDERNILQCTRVLYKVSNSGQTPRFADTASIHRCVLAVNKSSLLSLVLRWLWCKEIRLEVLSHPPYSLSIVSSDYHLFWPLKETLRWRHFLSDENVKTNVYEWLEINQKNSSLQAYTPLFAVEGSW